MIYDFKLAWRNIRNRPIQALVPILVVALAIALSVSVIVVADATQEGIKQSSDPFGMVVVGSAGSGQELVLSSVLLQGPPIGNIPYDVYQQLEDDDERVQLAVPLAFGDNINGARIIGTNDSFLELRSSRLAPPAFEIAEGIWLQEGQTFEAVLGWDAARRLGLEVGDQFRAVHGTGRGIAENQHDDRYTVIGILGRSNTAYDTAVYTQLETLWDAHDDDEHDDHADDDDNDEHADDDDHDDHADDDDHDEHEDDHAEHADDDEHDEHEDGDEHDEHADDDDHDEHADDDEHDEHADDDEHDEHEDDHAEDDEHDEENSLAGVPSAAPTVAVQEVGAAAERGEVTAVLVLPTGFREQNQIAQQFYLDPTLQAAFPGQELAELIGLLNQGQQALNLIGYLVLGIAGLTLFLSMYSAILARRQSVAIMRSLGSNRLSVFRMMIFETLIISLIGAVLGRILGYALAFGFSYVFSVQNALPMPVRFLWELEGVLWLLSLGVGLLAGLIPAWMAYRVNVVENLFPS